MNCEICDRRAPNPVKIRLEGAVLSVCESCAKLGKRVYAPPAFIRGQRKEYELPKEEIARNYASLVKSAREKKAWTQEQLAREVLEKEFIIHRIEQGRMQPTIELAKKLERALGIKLVEAAAQEKVEIGGIGNSAATIADFIKIKKKGN